MSPIDEGRVVVNDSRQDDIAVIYIGRLIADEAGAMVKWYMKKAEKSELPHAPFIVYSGERQTKRGGGAVDVLIPSHEGGET